MKENHSHFKIITFILLSVLINSCTLFKHYTVDDHNSEEFQSKVTFKEPSPSHLSEDKKNTNQTQKSNTIEDSKLNAPAQPVEP